MSPKKAMRKFARLVEGAPDDAQLIVGVAYDAREKWRVMMQIGAGLLLVGSATARGLADTFDKQKQLPEWRTNPGAAALEWLPVDLRNLAKECDDNNASGVVPPEVLAAMPTGGVA